MTSSSFTFDQFADDYDAALNEGIAISGEDKDFFASGRITWLKNLLDSLKHNPRTVMDFGCGIGSATPHLMKIVRPQSILGVDPSAKSLIVAQQSHGTESVHFSRLNDYRPRGEIDLAFCNGVFHHIPLSERAKSASYVYGSLKKDGLFAFWENNAWNPGARYCMRKNPFDKDAIPVTPRHAHHLLTAAGFTVLRIDYLFIFPRALRFFRPIEPFLSRLPFGAQYQILCKKM